MLGGAQMNKMMNLAFKKCNAMCTGEPLFKNLATTMASEMVKQTLGLKYALGAVKAYIAGDRPSLDSTQHNKVKL